MEEHGVAWAMDMNREQGAGLIGVILLTFVALFRIARRAGLLPAPYLLWTTSAVRLTIAIWRLNR
jgi:tryptophan-rich sensory protein